MLCAVNVRVCVCVCVCACVCDVAVVVAVVVTKLFLTETNCTENPLKNERNERKSDILYRFCHSMGARAGKRQSICVE